MKKLMFTLCLTLLNANAFALEASASMGNIRASKAADNAKIEALTTIVEALGTELKQTKTDLADTQKTVADIKECGDKGMIYTTTGCKAAESGGEAADVKTVKGNITYRADHNAARGSVSCPSGYKVVSCSANRPGAVYPSGNGCTFYQEHAGNADFAYVYATCRK